jgi:glycosyltransferase involved in cell wall biosynthesis
MKIVSIAASFVPSNTANSIQVVKATHALAALGHQVILIVPGDENASWEMIQRYYGVRESFDIRWIKENLTFRRYDFALKAVRMARELKPDLVYTWVLQAGLLALWRGLPVILECHDRITGRFGPWLFRRFCASKTRRRILTNTHALYRALMEEFDLGAESMDVLVSPNAVDLERYHDLPDPEDARKVLNLPAGFTAGYTGHFYAGRGMGLMVDLAKALPGIQFLWVGGASSDVILWKERLAADDVENITLTGFVDNAVLPQYQAAADVLLMPYGTSIAGSGGGNSADVASPMKMFEYLAASRPILSSDLPVFHEVLTQKEAIFCPPEDFTAWKEALLNLKNDSFMRRELAKAARKKAEENTWQSRAENALANFL